MNVTSHTNTGLTQTANTLLDSLFHFQNLSENSAVSGFSYLYSIILLYTSMEDCPAKRELEKALDVSGASIGSLSSLLSLLKSSMTSAAAIFVRPDLGTVKAAVAREQERFIHSTVLPLNSVKDVNAWCSASTNGRIPTIFDSINPDVVAVLASALYFKAKWKVPFNKHATEKEKFVTLDGTDRSVPMMKSTNSVAYWTSDKTGTTGVVLPYKDERFAGVVALPRENTKAALDATVAEVASGWAEKRASKQKVILTLPRFRVESTTDLMGSLAHVGLSSVTRDPGFISVLEGSPELVISQAVQKVFIDVDETGTEAAAVTAFGARLRAARPMAPPPVVRCDRPFVFSVVDVKSGMRLFTAVISDIKK